MDYRAVCSFFGGSIFHDELRGNFRDAQLQLDLLLLTIGEQPDHTKAEAFLLQAVTFLLQGKHADSQAWLDKIGEIPGISPRWLFRKSSYHILNVAMSRSPALAWPLHLLNTPVFEVWDSTSYPASAVKTFMAASKDLRQYVLPIDLFERDLFLFVFGISHLGFRAQECQYWTAGGREACEGLEEVEDFVLVLEGEQLSYAELRNRALELRLATTEISLQRLLLEANRALPSLKKDTFAQRLNDLWKICEAKGDDLGVAECIIITGDNLTSGQHASPLFLNMQIGDRMDEITLRAAQADYLTPLLDVGSSPVGDYGCESEGASEEVMAENVPQHSSLTGSDSAEIAKIDHIKAAWKTYDKADFIYQQKGHLRGTGAVKLRRACLLSMTVSSAGVMWADSRHVTQIKGRIEKLLVDAAEIFSACGDVIHEKLVKVHLFITQQLSTGSARQTREMGATAEVDRATMLQWYFASFAQRLGDYYRYLCSSKYGIHCHEIARLVCLRSPALRFVWFQSVDSITEFSIAFGFSQVAKASITSMLDSLPPLLERLEAAERINAEDVEAALSCKNLRWYIVQRLIRRVLSAYTAIGEFTKEGENVLTTLSGKLKDSPEQDFETVDLDTKDLIRIYIERRRCSRLLEDGHHSSFDEVARQMVDIYTQRPSFDVLEQCCAFMIDISDNSMPMRQFNEKFAQLDLQQLSYFHDRQAFCKLNGASNEQMEAGNYVMEIFLLERAMMICILMKQWENASRIMADLSTKLPGYATSVHCPTSSMPWQRRLWAGLIAEHEGRYNDALRLFFQSWYFATIGSTQDMDIEQKRFQMSFSDFARIYTCIARLCIYVRTERFSLPEPEATPGGDPNDSFRLLSATSNKHIPPERADETAIEWLELARARNTMTLLTLWKSDRPDSDLSQWLELSRKMTLWTELQSRGAMRTQAEEEEFLQLDQETDEMQNFLIDNLGVVSSEMGASSHRYKFAALSSSLPDDALVIYTAISQDGLALFGIDSSGILHRSWNPTVRPFQIRKAVSTYLGLMNKYQCAADLRVLEFLSSYLSSIFIRPLAHFVIQKEVIFFVPSGDIARFPLGALVLDNRYLFPWKKLCQVPSLSFYHHTRSTAALDSQFRASAIARPGSLSEQMSGGPAALELGAMEALHASLVVGAQIANASDVTRDQFRDLLRSCSILHISTHGRVNYERPGQSWITLKEPFRILDLSNVRSKVSAVIFSACFSGAGLAHSSGDVVGFSHAILATGAKAYVGALWKVQEMPTLLQMYFLYGMMPQQSDGIFLFRDVWHRANEILLSLDIPKARTLLDAITKEWDILERGGRDPDQFVKGGREALTETLEELHLDGAEALTDFQHPFIWAAFNVVGFADWGMRHNINRQ